MARLALLLVVANLHAAAIRGVAVDHYTGHPLARTVITLERVGAGTATARTGSSGQFVFTSLPPGFYLLSAARANYAVLKYGQKSWNAPGIPIAVAEDSAPLLELRLHHLAAISGTIWDENDVGIPEQDVYAYRATRPPTLAAHARTDDRGAYRIGGLAPGAYLVRAGAKQLDEDISVTPTFYRESIAVEDARPIDIALDDQAAEINIHPAFGSLLRLTGRVVSLPGPNCPEPLSVTLVSDMWTRTMTTSVFTFDQLPRGNYELVAICGENPVLSASFDRVSIFRDTQRVFQLARVPVIQLLVEDRDGKRVEAGGLSVFARRRDLAGAGIPFELKDGAQLLPGRWEFTATVSGGLYPVSISMPGPENQPGRGDAWTEFQLNTGRPTAPIKIVVASGATSVRGRVTRSINEPAAGAPVFLEAIDAVSKQRIVDLRRALTDTRGEYRFTGLAPGSYRVVSSFEFEDPDERMMEAARAPVVLTTTGSDAVQDLDLFVRP